jgi:hypothetical protein
MRLNPLSLRVLVLSWAVALVAWPAAWALLAVAQGVGVLLVGGGWIGLALPLGLHPWGIVNEPTVAFAGSTGALYLYWLAPSLLALLVAATLPTLAPVPGGWLAELAVFQLSLAAAALGLGWAPPLGVADGPAAALARFWRVQPGLFVALAAGAGVLTIQFSVVRLAGHLWSRPGGPTRSRRLLVVLAHGFAPAVAWAAAVSLSGFAVAPRALLTMGAVLTGALLGAWLWVSRSPLRHPHEPRLWVMIGVALVGVAAVVALLSVGSSGRGKGKAMLWGREGMTSNVRVGMDVVQLMPHRARRTPPAR